MFASLSGLLRRIQIDRYFRKVLSRVNFDVGSKMVNFLATGNLVSSTGLDLQQASGFTIVAEKLNWYRYISHFRCIHRGTFFANLKTTSVRKLLPEAWGQLAIPVAYFALELLSRIHMSSPYSGWFSMWTVKPFVSILSYSHYVT